MVACGIFLPKKCLEIFSMYEGNKILGIITARGGSKGVPLKNIKRLAGKPLIEWTIEAGLKSKYLDKIILSSDCDDIISVAKAAGCDVPFKRPVNLSGDKSSSMEVILHALDSIASAYSHFVLLQPTSPLRTSHHIDCMVESFFADEHEFMVSVRQLKKHPSFMYEINDGCLCSFLDNGGFQVRRQDMTPAYEHNGAIYMARVKSFIDAPSFNHERVGAFEMNYLDSVDIDEEIDFDFAELLLNKRER